MARVLERLGLSYTRTTYPLEKADTEKQKVFVEETFPNLIKLVDEEMISDTHDSSFLSGIFLYLYPFRMFRNLQVNL